MRRVPSILLPLCAYLAVALLLPILNGAYKRPDFVEHGAAVALVCGALAIGITLARRLASRCHSRRKSS